MPEVPYLNALARSWRTGPVQGSPIDFHRTLPGYAPTPLTPLPALARELGVGQVLIKDESARLGLPAFKILGASYAIARLFSDRLASAEVLPLGDLRERLEGFPLRLIAATDGNHGRAVAHVATLLGLASTIYVPETISGAAKSAIRGEGAELVELNLPYDDVVAHASAQAGPQSVIIQDTSWAGYHKVPQWIVDGYTTMLVEVDEQLRARGARPDVVVVPAGVGSLAHAVVSHYRSQELSPAIIVVEPENAPAVLTSLRAGGITPVTTAETVMTGLNCGTVSEAAWPVLRDGLDAAITVGDDRALTASSELAELGMDSGPCGAAPLAGARALLTDPTLRKELKLPEAPVVVLLSTEGRAANPKGFE